MPLEEDILLAIQNEPIAFRELLRKEEIGQALSDIGVFTMMLELHAPSEKARTTVGLGKTLCGRNGTRHASVTCKHCLKRMS